MQHPEIVREWCALDGAKELINIRDGSEGSTKLTDAANGNLEIVKILVEGGADVNMRRWGSDESALDIAVRAKNTDMIDYLWPLCSQKTRARAGLPNDPRAQPDK